MDNSIVLAQGVEQKIDEVSKSLDLPKNERTVLKLSPTDDPHRKNLALLSGSWQNKMPWIVVDENNEVHALTSSESFMSLVRSLQIATNENFGLKLEKAIWKYFPIDFHDVWVVATNELKKLLEKNENARILEIDIENLIDHIYKRHPNLFYHIKEENLLHSDESSHADDGGFTSHN